MRLSPGRMWRMDPWLIAGQMGLVLVQLVLFQGTDWRLGVESVGLLASAVSTGAVAAGVAQLGLHWRATHTQVRGNDVPVQLLALPFLFVLPTALAASIWTLNETDQSFASWAVIVLLAAVNQLTLASSLTILAAMRTRGTAGRYLALSSALAIGFFALALVLVPQTSDIAGDLLLPCLLLAGLLTFRLVAFFAIAPISAEKAKQFIASVAISGRIWSKSRRLRTSKLPSTPFGLIAIVLGRIFNWTSIAYLMGLLISQGLFFLALFFLSNEQIAALRFATLLPFAVQSFIGMQLSRGLLPRFIAQGPSAQEFNRVLRYYGVTSSALSVAAFLGGLILWRDQVNSSSEYIGLATAFLVAVPLASIFSTGQTLRVAKKKYRSIAVLEASSLAGVLLALVAGSSAGVNMFGIVYACSLGLVAVVSTILLQRRRPV